MSVQLSLEDDALVGKSWWSSEHGKCEVVARHHREMVGGEKWYRIQVRAFGGHRRFQMLWPENVVRGELGNPNDVWVGDNTSGFVNGSEHLRLAGLGLVPLDPEVAQATAAHERSSVESRVVRDREEGAVMAVASTRKPARPKKGGGLATLSKTALRKKLLETVTISDGAWAAYRKQHGLPEREPEETREAFIKRVLA